jgi:hypothetical protein
MAASQANAGSPARRQLGPHVGRITEKQERLEVIHTKETFGGFWPRWLSRRKPYLSEGTWKAYERDGRLRLLPALESIPLERLEVDHVRDLVEELAESMEAGDIAPKTINNTYRCLARWGSRVG